MKRLFAVVLTLAVLAPAGIPAGAHESGHRQQLDRLEDRLERNRQLLREATREREGVLGDIADSDRRRDALTDKIEELAAELEASEERLAEAETSLEIARGSLSWWNRRLDRTREALGDQRHTLQERAAAAYRIGGAGLIEVVLGAEDMRSLADRLGFVRTVLDSDARLVGTISSMRTQVAAQRNRVSDYETVLAGHRDAVREEVRRIQQLKAEQESIRAEVEAAIAEREELLEDIESSRSRYRRAVEALEAESARIRGLIQGGGSTGSGNPNARFYWPAPGPITSGYGWRTHPIFGTQRFHAGVDIDADCGDPIWSGEDGVVISAYYSEGYGNVVIVDHGRGLSTLYAHQSHLSVSSGQQVSRAQRIGTVGTTGWSTGCHLHFEVRVNGEPVDPVPYLS